MGTALGSEKQVFCPDPDRDKLSVSWNAGSQSERQTTSAAPTSVDQDQISIAWQRYIMSGLCQKSRTVFFVPRIIINSDYEVTWNSFLHVYC